MENIFSETIQFDSYFVSRVLNSMPVQFYTIILLFSYNITDIQEAQQARKRRNGMTALECALGKKMAGEFDEHEDDPFGFRSGKMMTLSSDKKQKLTAEEITTDLQDQFKKEQLLFDEDEEMKKYIENQMNGGKDQSSFLKEGELSREDEILFRAAKKFEGMRSKMADESTSGSMLGGIPEVDLGIEARMKNVMNTEQLKSQIAANNGKLPEPDNPRKKYRRFQIN